MNAASEDSRETKAGDLGNVVGGFEVRAMSSDDSDDSEEEEEMVEVCDGTNTLYFHSKDGMAQCEYCGNYGIRDSFYSKTKEYCSINCSRNYATAVTEGTPFPKSVGGGKITIKSFTNRKRSRPKKPKGFDWSKHLIKNPSMMCASVKGFQHVPLADSWDVMNPGMKLEVINYEAHLPTEVYWIASVIKLSGYNALLRYEGFGDDGKKDFWSNLVATEIHPVGWCAANDRPLVPPREIQDRYGDWKEFLVKRLTGSSTLPHNFHSSLQAQRYDCPLKKGMFVEVVDKMCLSATRVATIEEMTGTRVKVKYVDSPYDDDLFYCDYCSPLLHPVGWSQLVGHRINATLEYCAESLEKITNNTYGERDTTPQMFPAVLDIPSNANGVKFQAGMKLEAIDPLNLSAICVASVMKVLKNNYLMIGIDGSPTSDGSDWFCYHACSPCIFPAGFCEVNELELTTPGDHKGAFSWPEYLSRSNKSAAVPVKLFNKENIGHGFKVGVKLEAADLMDPRLICVATVAKVLGRLLRIHFDGWEDGYDQWVDCQSPDIYPTGWCAMVNFPLEGPKTDEPSPKPAKITKKRKSKNSKKV